MGLQDDNWWALLWTHAAPCFSPTKGAWPRGPGVLCRPLPTAIPGEGACWAHARWKTAGTACASLFEAGLRGFIQTASYCLADYGRGWVGNGLLLAFGHQDCLRQEAEMSFSFLGSRGSCRPAGRAAWHHRGGDIQSGALFNIARGGVAKHQEWGSLAHPTTGISSSSINCNSHCYSSLH